MQNAYFVQDTLRVTQGPNGSFSHSGSQAVDFGGANTGAAGSVDKCYAPYDCRVVRLREGANGECYIESLDRVLAPNGRAEKQNMLLLHAGRFRVKQGDVLRQGQHFYDEGGMQGGNPAALAPHVHIEAGFGPSPARQEKNSAGTWVLPGQSPLHELLFVPEGVPIAAGGGLAWKRAPKGGEPGGSAQGNAGAGTNGDPNTSTESEEEENMYRLYEVTFASKSYENAKAEFERIRAAGGRPGFDFAASDGKYRVGNCLMATADPAALLENMAPNRFVG